MRLFRNKKGDSGQEEKGMLPRLLITVVIACIIIFGLYALTQNPLKMLFSNFHDQSATQEFERFILSLDSKDEHFVKLPSKYFIIGFSPDMELDFLQNKLKPCESCICLYNWLTKMDCKNTEKTYYLSSVKPKYHIVSKKLQYDTEKYYPIIVEDKLSYTISVDEKDGMRYVILNEQ